MRKPSEAFIGLALVLIAGGAILFSVMMTLLGSARAENITPLRPIVTTISRRQ